MKVGILTYHYVLNEGATWQAYTLCSILRRQMPGHDVEIIDFRYARKFERLRSLRSPEHRNPHEEILGPLLSTRRIVSNDWQDISDIIESEFDLCIVGSDIVWQFDFRSTPIQKVRRVLLYNPIWLNTSSLYSFLRDIKNWTLRVMRQASEDDPLKIDVPNVYWLPGPFQCTRVSYAASIGYSDPKSVLKRDRKWMVECLSRFVLLSVRDTETQNFLAMLDPGLGQRTRVVPDPAWLFEESLPDGRKLLEELGVDVGRPKAGVLYPRGNFYTKRFDQEITQGLRDRGFQVISIIDRNPLADFDCGAHPRPVLAWWSLIREMDFLFTVRTHPTIAALMYHTPFLNIDITSRIKGAKTSKSHSMLKDFDLHRFCLYRPSDFKESAIKLGLDEAIHYGWNWDQVDQQISVYRERATEFIHDLKELVNANY